MAVRGSDIFESMIEEEHGKHSKTENSVDLNQSKVDSAKHSNFINIYANNQIQQDKKAKYIQKEYNNYLNETGIKTAFEIIFNEIIANKISSDDVFQFTSNRLREIGQKLKEVDDL